MFGDNYRNDIPGYWSDRLYLSLGCGAFLMYPRVPGIEKYFIDGTHLVLYDNENDLHDKITHYLEKPEERERISRAGAQEVAKNHNWSVRVTEALGLIEGIL
jgi:spore maturation protein CgeB